MSLLLGFFTVALMWRAVDLHVFNKDFLQEQGDARYLRDVPVPAHRGMITDRHGEPLAISTPVESVWVNPRALLQQQGHWAALAAELELDVAELRAQLLARQDKEFMYLRRHLNPETVKRIAALEVPGVAFKKEYKRFYPAGEVVAHLVGFTDVDDSGQEGVELAFNHELSGTPGSHRVIKDRLGRVVETVERIREPRPGKDVILSIDRRVQYLAYRELKAAVKQHNADAGSAVILDAKTGEVLAMVNQPAFNPNNRDELRSASIRNRAMTDVFEPGSTIKPFTVAAGLQTGMFEPQTVIDTAPGLLKVGRKLIRDSHNYGRIDVSTVLKKSSNVGASKMALAIEPRQLWEALAGSGFGVTTGSGFPGESSGSLPDYSGWHDLERATMSYGYGLSVTPLQLARAYTVFANNGYLPRVSLLRTVYGTMEASYDEPVLNPVVLTQVRGMLESVTHRGGTGTKARVTGYRVAGKTGTVKKIGEHGYEDGSYMSIFAGMAPASDPRLIMVVMINEPRGKQYYGGAVAAPIFSKVMSGALRMLDIPPDDVPALSGAHYAWAGQ
ncbi:MAG: penicillin-binding transpeptidase domain-containing protein [Gammaproteobacteria bacterium]|nr:penicillin-binding transpeptidase domain-containing protein [Gammaproteobacteria bacterium]